ncbi:MAG: hypothetical protein ACPIOQ_85195, partial [Promethearchaeia archaeon]
AVRGSAFARCALLSSLRLGVAGVQGGKRRDAEGAVLGAAGFRSFKEGRLSARKPSGTSWQPLLLSGRALLAPSAQSDFGARHCAVVESGGSAPDAVAGLSSSRLSAKKESLLQCSKPRKGSFQRFHCHCFPLSRQDGIGRSPAASPAPEDPQSKARQ